MRVLGIDPGLRNLGWGVIEVQGSRLSHIANGVCHSIGDDLGARLLSLYEQLGDIVQRFDPQTAAVEQTFVNKDGAGTLKLGQARAVALLVPARRGLDVAEYAPNAVKKAVVGVGHADKAQVGWCWRWAPSPGNRSPPPASTRRASCGRSRPSRSRARSRYPHSNHPHPND